MANTTDPTLVHAFPDAGNYTTVLIIEDGLNESRQAMLVRVAARPATPTSNFGESILTAMGMVVILTGSIGVGYALATRPSRKPASGVVDTPDPAGATLVFAINSCTGCGDCSKLCPAKAIRMASGSPKTGANGKNPPNIPVVEAAICTGCGKCMKNCLQGAITPGPAYKGKSGG